MNKYPSRAELILNAHKGDRYGKMIREFYATWGYNDGYWYDKELKRFYEDDQLKNI